MDKAQKELIKTYYRKRSMAVEQGNNMEDIDLPEHMFRPYEYSKYALNNNIINSNNFNTQSAIDAIIQNPKIINYMNDFLNEFDIYDIADILKNQPQLIEYFEDKLGELESYNIADILGNQPQLIEYFEDRLGELKSYNIADILKNQPQLIEYFEDRLGELNDKNIGKILIRHPKLTNYFAKKLNLSKDYLNKISTKKSRRVRKINKENMWFNSTNE